MSADVHYEGHDGFPKTLTRTANGTTTAIPVIAWAGTGTCDWGTWSAATVDTAVSVLHAELADLALACRHGPQLAARLAETDPSGFTITAPELLAAAGLAPPAPPPTPPAPPLTDFKAVGHGDDGEAPVMVFTVPAVPIADALALWCAQGRAAEELNVDVELLDEPLDARTARALCNQLDVSPYDLWGPDEAFLVEQLTGLRSVS